MISIRQLIVSSTVLLAISQSSLALQMRGQNPPSPASASSTRVVERGGTVTSYDPAKKIIVVDKVQFVLNSMPVKIHPPPEISNEKNFVLTPGMQIRFNTSKENFSAQDQVQEIWVTSLDGKPTAK